jgi:hypothetical protein
MVDGDRERNWRNQVDGKLEKAERRWSEIEQDRARSKRGSKRPRDVAEDG